VAPARPTRWADAFGVVRRLTRGALLAGLATALAVPPAAVARTPAAALAAASPGWSIHVIDSIGGGAGDLSLAVHPLTGQPHIAYYSVTETDLKLAFPAAGGDCGPGNTWSCNSLAFPNKLDFGTWPSLAFFPAGQWGIAYYSGSELKNGYRGLPAQGASEQFWTDIDDSAGLNSLVINDDGQAEVAFAGIVSDTLVLRHARYVGAAGNCGDNNRWQCQTVAALSADDFTTALAMDALDSSSLERVLVFRGLGGVLRMAFQPAFGGANCGTLPVFTWHCELIDDSVDVVSVALRVPSASELHVAYVDLTSASLKYAWFAPGTGNCSSADWRCVRIDAAEPGENGYGVALAARNGSPFIAYLGRDAQDRAVLKVARPRFNGNCGPIGLNLQHTWQCDVVDDGLRGDGYHNLGSAVSVAFGPAGQIYIAYTDASAGELLLARTTFALWLPAVQR
jgi:hypothetical protein